MSYVPAHPFYLDGQKGMCRYCDRPQSDHQPGDGVANRAALHQVLERRLRDLDLNCADDVLAEFALLEAEIEALKCRVHEQGEAAQRATAGEAFNRAQAERAADKLRAALLATRGQWIHSVNAPQCIEALSEWKGSEGARRNESDLKVTREEELFAIWKRAKTATGTLLDELAAKVREKRRRSPLESDDSLRVRIQAAVSIILGVRGSILERTASAAEALRSVGAGPAVDRSVESAPQPIGRNKPFGVEWPRVPMINDIVPIHGKRYVIAQTMEESARAPGTWLRIVFDCDRLPETEPPAAVDCASPQHATESGKFRHALEAVGVPREPLEVYSSNSTLRVGLKGRYREVVWASVLRDGVPTIVGHNTLAALVAAFNAMLAEHIGRDR